MNTSIPSSLLVFAIAGCAIVAIADIYSLGTVSILVLGFALGFMAGVRVALPKGDPSE